MNETEKRQYYLRSDGNIFEERVSRTWIVESYKIAESNFCQRFSYLTDYLNIFSTIFWYIWRNHPKNDVIDPEIIKNELIPWLGKDKVDEAVLNNPEEFEVFLRSVQDLFDMLTKEYYSGLVGKMLLKWESLPQKQKAEKYKKLD